MQFGRFPITKKTKRGKLPDEWTEELNRTLTEAYYDQSEKDDCFFDIYGEIYEKEFVVIASYVHHTEQMSSPISIFISHDIVDESKQFKSVLKNLVDLLGSIFDDIFAHDDWNEYTSHWTENKYNAETFHYKITRENISHTLQAQQILNNQKF